MNLINLFEVYVFYYVIESGSTKFKYYFIKVFVNGTLLTNLNTKETRLPFTSTGTDTVS